MRSFLCLLLGCIFLGWMSPIASHSDSQPSPSPQTNPAPPEHPPEIDTEDVAGPPSPKGGHSNADREYHAPDRAMDSARAGGGSVFRIGGAFGGLLGQGRTYKLHLIRGEVRSIDEKNWTITVKSKDTTRVYKTTRYIVFMPEGMSLSDLKPGEHIHIAFFFHSRRRVAVKVTLLNSGMQ